MQTGLYQRKKTNGLVTIMSKLTSELAYPFRLYSNYRRDLSEGKRNLRLNHLKRKGELGYERKLDEYEQKLERKLQESEMSEEMFDIVSKGITYLGENYDWEKEKRQARAIGKGTLEVIRRVAKGAGLVRKKVKIFAQKEWEKEKYIIKERVGKLKVMKEEFQGQRKEKLFLYFNKLKNELTKINNQVSKLDPEKSYIYINNLKWGRDKIYKNFEKAENKLRQGGYPI